MSYVRFSVAVYKPAASDLLPHSSSIPFPNSKRDIRVHHGVKSRLGLLMLSSKLLQKGNMRLSFPESKSDVDYLNNLERTEAPVLYSETRTCNAYVLSVLSQNREP
jgi:hypothetical protein